MKLEFNKLRPCIVKTTEEKGLFHGFFQVSHTTKPTILPTGFDPGGLKHEVFAIVELEDGHVARVNPTNIKFLDGKIEEYDFTDERGVKNDL